MLLSLLHPANTAPLDFAKDGVSRIAQLLDIAPAVAHADHDTAPVWVAVPRTESRSCPTKALTKPHGRRHVAQAALSPCDWSEKRCVSTDCPSYIPLNAEPVTYHLHKKGTQWRPDLSVPIIADYNFLATASLPARFARSPGGSNRLACAEVAHHISRSARFLMPAIDLDHIFVEDRFVLHNQHRMREPARSSKMNVEFDFGVASL